MSGVSEVRTKSALKILKRNVSLFSKSFYDPSELESIGYEVIAVQLDKELQKNESWEGFIDICLRRAFRKHIVKSQKTNKKGSFDDIAIMEEGLDGRSLPISGVFYTDFSRDIENADKINELIECLPEKQREAVEHFLRYGSIENKAMRDDFNNAIKNIRGQLQRR